MDTTADFGALGVIGPIVWAVIAFLFVFKWGGLRLVLPFGPFL